MRTPGPMSRCGRRQASPLAWNKHVVCCLAVGARTAGLGRRRRAGRGASRRTAKRSEAQRTALGRYGVVLPDVSDQMRS